MAFALQAAYALVAMAVAALLVWGLLFAGKRFSAFVLDRFEHRARGVQVKDLEIFSAAQKRGGLILHTSVTIGYGVPWQTIQGLLISAAGRTADVLKKPDPFVMQASLSDFYVSCEINAYTDRPERMAVNYSDLHRHIQDTFAEAGVEIMSPHSMAQRGGARPAIPEPAGTERAYGKAAGRGTPGQG